MKTERMPRPQKMELGHSSKNVDKRKAMIISGFAAIGKSSFSKDAEVRKRTKMDIIDLDSGLYSKYPALFPGNYEDAIRKYAEKRCIILISTHEKLPSRLAEEGYYVALVYPSGGLDAKKQWLQRLEKREVEGKESPLYKATSSNWGVWFQRTAKENVTIKWTLSNGQYLIDIFDPIFDKFQASRRRSREQGGK